MLRYSQYLCVLITNIVLVLKLIFFYKCIYDIIDKVFYFVQAAAYFLL